MALVVSPADVVIIVICNQNADGTLSPALSPSASTPKVLPVDAQYVWVFNSQNADGSLSPSTVS
jgi:hypothetical protein